MSYLTTPPASNVGFDRRSLLRGAAGLGAAAGIGLMTGVLPAHAAGPTLRKGVVHAEVGTLQDALRYNWRQNFLNHAPTNNFGDLTYWALVNWQFAAGYATNGQIVVGSAQWNQLRREYITAASGLRRYQGSYITHFPSSGGAWTKGRSALISISDMRIYMMFNGSVQMSTKIRTGQPGFATPLGSFAVQYKVKDEVSREYGNAPMPYSVYFAAGGIAIHYSADFAARGYAYGSHGCVNIASLARAADIFNHLRPGNPVLVYRGGRAVNCYGRW